MTQISRNEKMYDCFYRVNFMAGTCYESIFHLGICKPLADCKQFLDLEAFALSSLAYLKPGFQDREFVMYLGRLTI